MIETQLVLYLFKISQGTAAKTQEPITAAVEPFEVLVDGNVYLGMCVRKKKKSSQEKKDDRKRVRVGTKFSRERLRYKGQWFEYHPVHIVTGNVGKL